MNICDPPLTMISEMSGSRIRCSIGLKNGNMVSNCTINSSQHPAGNLVEIGNIGVEVIRLQIAERGWGGIHPVIREHNGLSVGQFRKKLLAESVIEPDAVAL